MQAATESSYPLPISRRVLLAAALTAGVVAACGERKAPAASFHSVNITGADYAQNWSLPDVNGVRRTLKDFEGKVVYIFFGFAQCPDVCPTTMLELAEVKQALGPAGDGLQVIFVTVDPDRDTPEILREYVAAFDPSFTALVGSPDEVAAVAKDFKVFYKKVPGPTPESYTVDHSAGSYLYDPKGRLRLYAKYGTPAEQLKEDIQKLLQGL